MFFLVWDSTQLFVARFLEGDNLVKLGLLLDLGFREVPCIVVVAVGWPLWGVPVVGVLELKFDDLTIPFRIIFMGWEKWFNFKCNAKGPQPLFMSDILLTETFQPKWRKWEVSIGAVLVLICAFLYNGIFSISE